LLSQIFRLPRDLDQREAQAETRCNAPCKGFESAAVALLGPALWLLLVKLAHCPFLLSISPYRSLRSRSKRQPRRPQSRSVQSTLSKNVPTVPGSKPAVKKCNPPAVPGNFEAHVTVACPRQLAASTWLQTMAVLEFHRAPPQALLALLVMTSSFRSVFRSHFGLRKRRSCFWSCPDTSRSYDSNATSVAAPENFLQLKKEQFFVERILRRVVWQELNLAYEVHSQATLRRCETGVDDPCSIVKQAKRMSKVITRSAKWSMRNVHGVPLFPTALFFLGWTC